MFKNKYITAYLSFVAGFGLVFFAQLVLAVVVGPDTGPLQGSTVTPVVHSIDIAEGSSDPDGSGVSINNDGQITITATNLGGSYSVPQYGMSDLSNKGGLKISSPYNPIAAKNSVNTTPEPDEYGRVGVEGRVVGREDGYPAITKGFVGHVKHLLAPNNDYKPLTENFPGTLVPYSFFTTGNTYLGDTVTIDGNIRKSFSNVDVFGDAMVVGNLEIDETLQTDVLNFSNPTNLSDRFFKVQTPYPVPTYDSNYADEEIFTESANCPSDAYVVGCSGFINNVGSWSYKIAPYRGARMTSSSSKGGTCTSYARKPVSPPPGPDHEKYTFSMTTYAYCFRPH